MSNKKTIKCKISLEITIFQLLRIFFESYASYYDQYHDKERYSAGDYENVANNIQRCLSIKVEMERISDYDLAIEMVENGDYRNKGAMVSYLRDCCLNQFSEKAISNHILKKCMKKKRRIKCTQKKSMKI